MKNFPNQHILHNKLHSATFVGDTNNNERSRLANPQGVSIYSKIKKSCQNTSLLYMVAKYGS